MSNLTGFLPGLSHHLMGREVRNAATGLKAQSDTLSGLAALVARFVPADVLAAVGERDRVYTPWVTFVSFLGQVLTRGSSCREAVRRVQSWRLASKQSVPDESTSGYCQARQRLPLEALREVHDRVGDWINRHRQEGWKWCGRSVRVLDGSGVSMPDTDENRAKWPYAGGQRPGCGFPTAKMVGLFCMATGRLIRFALDSWKTHEIPLAREMVGWVEPGEIVLTDRGFCGWGLIALFQRKKVDVVMRAHQARKLSGSTMQWTKPQRHETWDKALWSELPEALTVRIVRFQIIVPGFRTTEVALITTLLDTKAYPDKMIAALYQRRWAVELYLRDIKTTLGLDVLRCQSPELIEKEIWLQAIAHNLVRALMLEASWVHNVPLDRLSFKGTVDTLRQWTPLMAPSMFAFKRAREELIRVIAADQVPDRPNRSEPRVQKRRHKNYQRLTKPRHEMKVSASRAKK